MTIEEIQIELGKKIVNLRKTRNMKQIHLALKIGIEDSALRRIEKGKTNSTLKTLIKISEALGVSLSELVNFDQFSH